MRNAKQVVSLLNEILEMDRAAISCLFLNRVPANEILASHPLVNIWDRSGMNAVGILGVLNGILQECELEQIAMVINEQYPETILFFEHRDPRLSLVKGQKNKSLSKHQSPSGEE